MGVGWGAACRALGRAPTLNGAPKHAVLDPPLHAPEQAQQEHMARLAEQSAERQRALEAEVVGLRRQLAGMAEQREAFLWL